MNINIDEHLSALMDGEESDINILLDNIHDDNVRKRWVSYHLTRDVLRNHISSVTNIDISAKVQTALENEPTILNPSYHQKQHSRMRILGKQFTGMAVAASITAIAIFIVQQNSTEHTNPVTSVAQQTINEQNIQLTSTKTTRLDEAVESKLNGYLVNHNEYSNFTNMQGVMPYTRVVNFTPTRRVSNAR